MLTPKFQGLCNFLLKFYKIIIFLKVICYNKLDFRCDVIIVTERDIIYLIETTLNNKLAKDENFIRYTFYELRVRLDLSEEELYYFLKFIKIKLENLGYRAYFAGDRYVLNENNKQVKDNELLIAIKEQGKNEYKKQSE